MAKGFELNFWTITVIALLAYAFIPGVQTFVGGIFGGSSGGTGGTGGSGGSGGTGGTGGGTVTICDPSAKVTLSVDTNDKFASASDITNGSHRVFVDGLDKGFVSEGGTLTVAPKQKYKVVLGQNSTSHYPVVKEGEVPCSGTLNVGGGLAAMDNSLTFTVWNENGQVLSTTQTQDVNSNDVLTLPFKIAVTSKQSFGDPDHPGIGNVLCTVYNKTAYDSVKVDGASKAPAPTAVSTGSVNETACYYVPVVQNDPAVADGTKVSDKVVDGRYDGNFILDASSTFTSANPGHNVTFTVSDSSVDLDADTLALIFDIEDETNNNLGTDVEQMGTIYTS